MVGEHLDDRLPDQLGNELSLAKTGG
jgi:hypothetical protein